VRPVSAGLALKKAALRSVPPLYSHRKTPALHFVHGLGAELRGQRRQRPARGVEHPESALTIQNDQRIAQVAAVTRGDL
jgi:hypothetical protein